MMEEVQSSTFDVQSSKQGRQKSYKRIEAVRKALRVLKFMGNEKTAVSSQSIAQAVGLPKDTVMCQLATLEDEGFVQGVGDNWRIGMAAALLWARVKANLEEEKEKVNKNLELLKGGINGE